MYQFYFFIVSVFLVGILWGIAIHTAWVKYRIGRGVLPGFLNDKKVEIDGLFKKGGDENPQAPGSGPG